MKVVQVPRRFTREQWGGTETVILETCRRLPALGCQTLVVCPSALARPGPDQVAGVEVQRLPYFYPYLGLSPSAREAMDQVAGNLFSWSLLHRLLTLPGLDLIHLHTGKRLGGIGRVAARRRGIPYLVSLHGGALEVPAAEAARLGERSGRAWEWGKLLGWLVGSRRVLRDAAAVICLNRAEQQRLEKELPGQRVELIPNGVNPAALAAGDGPAFCQAQGIDPTRRLLSVVGRLDPQKDQLAVVEALPALLVRHPDLHLLLLGPVTNPDYAALVRRRVAELGLEERVSLVPGLPPGSPALAGAYAASAALVLPSRHEPFGIVILEAWAAGLPVVGRGVGGVRDLVEDGRDGLVFAEDDPAGLVRGLDQILSDPELARRLGEQGRAKALAHYTWDAVSQRLYRLYRELATAHPVR